jgi:ubiquinone/menaquinone biosynthesis methyltransferase
MTNHSDEQTNFGFQTVNKQEKASMVREVFSAVADDYDLMNDAMSLGLHRLWKRKLVAQLRTGAKLLDVAGGTGDIAIKYFKKHDASHMPAAINILDINEAMVARARDKMIDQNITGIQCYVGDAESLPFPDMSFDYYTIAFGLRNVTDKDRALREAYRVLKPGGKFFCLEFSQVQNELLARLYDFYSFHIIPPMGHLLANNESAYQYLVESIRTFPAQQELCNMIRHAGFALADYDNLNSGIVALHHGYRT